MQIEFDAEHLDLFATTAKDLEDYIVQTLTEKGIKLKIYENLETFLEA